MSYNPSQGPARGRRSRKRPYATRFNPHFSLDPSQDPPVPQLDEEGDDEQNRLVRDALSSQIQGGPREEQEEHIPPDDILEPLSGLSGEFYSSSDSGGETVISTDDDLGRNEVPFHVRSEARRILRRNDPPPLNPNQPPIDLVIPYLKNNIKACHCINSFGS